MAGAVKIRGLPRRADVRCEEGRAGRGGGWRTVEAPLALAEAVAALDAAGVAVVDGPIRRLIWPIASVGLLEPFPDRRHRRRFGT